MEEKSLPYPTLKGYFYLIPKGVETHELLERYCLEADELDHDPDFNYGYGSLKFVIYTLRDTSLERSKIFAVFLYLVKKSKEDFCYVTDWAYDQTIFWYPRAKQYFELARRFTHQDLLREIRFINKAGLIIAVNETIENLTKIIFKRYPEVDLIIFRNHQESWAGIVKRAKERKVDLDLQAVRQLLPSEESWVIPYENILICGGPKAPEQKTKLGVAELIEAIEKVRIAPEERGER